MKKQLLIIGIVTLLVSIGLSGCEQSVIKTENDRFVGTWENTSIPYINGSYFTTTIEIFSDEKCSYMGEAGIWDLKDGKFVMELPEEGLTWTYNYVFSNNDKTLSLTSTTDDSTTVFTKQ